MSISVYPTFQIHKAAFLTSACISRNGAELSSVFEGSDPLVWGVLMTLMTGFFGVWALVGGGT